jgi:prevent-host-death family protein
MRAREHITQTMKASDARQNFSEVVNEVFRGKKRVLVEKSGIPVVGIISAQDLALLEQLERRREEDFKALDATRAAFQDVSDEELDREVARALAEARERRRGPLRTQCEYCRQLSQN